jgi:hypothetical protein
MERNAVMDDTTNNGKPIRSEYAHVWSGQQIDEIARRIAARDMCSFSDARRSLTELMDEGRLPRYQEALRNTVPPDVTVAQPEQKETANLRGWGKANRKRREAEQAQAEVVEASSD